MIWLAWFLGVELVSVAWIALELRVSSGSESKLAIKAANSAVVAPPGDAPNVDQSSVRAADDCSVAVG